MGMLEKGLRRYVLVIFCVSLLTLMYYSRDEYIFFFPVRNVFACLICLTGLLAFLVKPDVPKAMTALRLSFIFCMPILIGITASLVAWFVQKSWNQLIWYALQTYVIYSNQILASLVAASLLYLFGEEGMWYNLAAIVAANLLMLGATMAEAGVAPFFREFWRLVITFADDTGSIIVKAEIHELAFCLGAYLLYMMLFPQRKLSRILLMFLASFAFLAAMKRIAVLAMAVCLAVGFFLKLLLKFNRKRAVSRLITGSLILLCLALIVYIPLVRGGLFNALEKLGINTMGRNEIYDGVKKLYYFSPAYAGQGMGFITYQLRHVLTLRSLSLHNDFLHFYIELGFTGYILWLLSMTLLRTEYLGRKGKTGEKMTAYVMILFSFIVSSTDNTMHYQLFYTVIALLTIGHGFDGRVADERRRLHRFAFADDTGERDGEMVWQ